MSRAEGLRIVFSFANLKMITISRYKIYLFTCRDRTLHPLRRESTDLSTGPTVLIYVCRLNNTKKYNPLQQSQQQNGNITFRHENLGGLLSTEKPEPPSYFCGLKECSVSGKDQHFRHQRIFLSQWCGSEIIIFLPGSKWKMMLTLIRILHLT